MKMGPNKYSSYAVVFQLEFCLRNYKEHLYITTEYERTWGKRRAGLNMKLISGPAMDLKQRSEVSLLNDQPKRQSP